MLRDGGFNGGFFLGFQKASQWYDHLDIQSTFWNLLFLVNSIFGSLPVEFSSVDFLFQLGQMSCSVLALGHIQKDKLSHLIKKVMFKCYILTLTPWLRLNDLMLFFKSGFLRRLRVLT